MQAHATIRSGPTRVGSFQGNDDVSIPGTKRPRLSGAECRRFRMSSAADEFEWLDTLTDVVVGFHY